MTDSQCPCDERIHPRRLEIHAGLNRIPRQIAGFPEFRRAMLAELSKHAALGPWRARSEDDLGVMLLEMWAYVCDVLAFYDETIAHECYLRTARLRPSIRRLTDLLGYVPRPAVAATVLLAAFAEGRKPVTLLVGTAFRSKAFDGEPPQIFELDAETTIHPLNNEWQVEPVSSGAIAATTGDSNAEGTATANSGMVESGDEISQLLLDPEFTDVKEGDIVLLRIAAHDVTAASRVTALDRIIGEDGETYDQATFNPSLALGTGVAPEDIEILRSTQRASIWTQQRADSDPIPLATGESEIFATEPSGGSYGHGGGEVGPASLVLDGLYREIKPGDYLVLTHTGDLEHRWFRITRVRECLMHLTELEEVTLDGDAIPVPAVLAPATKLLLDAPINDRRHGASGVTWRSSFSDRIVVHYAFVAAATVAVAKRVSLSVRDPLSLMPSGNGFGLRVSAEPPSRFLIFDSQGESLDARGSYDPYIGRLTLNPDAAPDLVLAPPIAVCGNVLLASRGETARDEVLGSGDASVAGQTFQLKKKPLTYFASPTADNDRAVASTLRVWVDGILWDEVPSFFGTTAYDAVYIVRQTDEGDSQVIFGDGVRGRRLPTGRDNVVASYRFGAGAKAPPAGGITQIAKPITGLKSVRNPLAAGGGADADSAEHIRTHAPDSVLLLGRAVSIRDFEAAADGMPGVRAVRAEWRWDGVRQGAVVKLWYIGDPGVEAAVCEALRNKADPTVTIDVERATPQQLDLILTIEIDPRRREEAVFAAVREALMDPQTGILAPENIGIGQPLFRSRIFEQVLAVDGTVAVTQIRHFSCGKNEQVAWCEGGAFQDSALRPPAGRYFDLEEEGSLTLNRRERADG